jgi:hypothetical protein
MKLDNHPLVAVLWDDAFMSMDEYTQEEAEQLHRPEQVWSYGLLVREDERGVMLAMDAGVTDGKFRKITFIPKGMVVEVVELSKARKRGRKKDEV